MVETLETSHTWTRLDELHAAVGGAIRDSLAGQGTPGLVLCHLSHAYADGASLYFTFISRARHGEEVEQWRKVKRAASEAIVAAGGTITHHHAVGRDHAPYMEAEVGETGPRRAARGQGAARPGRDHEPRQAAPLRPSRSCCRPRRSAPVILPRSTRVPVRSDSSLAFLCGFASRRSSRVGGERDVDLVEGAAGDKASTGWGSGIWPRSRRSRGPDAPTGTIALARAGEPDRVGLTRRRRLQALRLDLQQDVLSEAAEDGLAAGVAAVDRRRAPPGSALGFVGALVAGRLGRRGGAGADSPSSPPTKDTRRRAGRPATSPIRAPPAFRPFRGRVLAAAWRWRLGAGVPSSARRGASAAGSSTRLRGLAQAQLRLGTGGGAACSRLRAGAAASGLCRPRPAPL